MFESSPAATYILLVIIALYVLRELRNRLLPRIRTDFGVLNVAFSDTGSEINAVMETLERHGVEVRSLGAQLEGDCSRYTIQLRIPPRHGVQVALEEISTLSSVERMNVTGLREVE